MSLGPTEELALGRETWVGSGWGWRGGEAREGRGDPGACGSTLSGSGPWLDEP